MTIAICIFCGEFKFGALLPCDHCGQRPGADEAAKSVVITDHYYNRSGLTAIGEIIKGGYDVFALMPDLQAMAEEQEVMIAQMADPNSDVRREMREADRLAHERQDTVGGDSDDEYQTERD